MLPKMTLFEEKRESTPEVQAKEILRILIIGFLGLIGILIFLLRLVDLQIWNRDVYVTESEQNSIRHLPLPPPRGRILDRNGVVLAQNQTFQSLYVLTDQVASLDATLSELRNTIALSDTEIEQFLKDVKRGAWPLDGVLLKSDLTEDEIYALALDRYRFPSIRTGVESIRYYPHGHLVAHAIGSVRRIEKKDWDQLPKQEYRGTDFVGRHGVERVYESVLHGRAGYRRVEVDARGRVVKEIDHEAQTSGVDLTLFLDANVQKVADQALGERYGAVVALEVKTGGVIALVSKPSYDPNIFLKPMTNEQWSAIQDPHAAPLNNRAIKGLYPPGSTIKPVVGLAALAHGVTDWDEIVVDSGEFFLPSSTRAFCRDWNWKPDNPGGQGRVDMYRAIYRSSNVYFCTMGYRLGIDRLAPFAAQFGFGRARTFDLRGADPGRLPDREWLRAKHGQEWFLGHTLNLSIGQGDLVVTPLQVAMVAAILARKGERIRPRMVQDEYPAVLKPAVVYPLPPVSGPSEQDWNRMRSAMEAVVSRGDLGLFRNGTAYAYVGIGLPYRFAGKSGTAQVKDFEQGKEYKEEETPEHERNHAWFMGFAPADDPQIAVAVIVEHGGGGSRVAAPVARAVLDAYLLPAGVVASAK